jgi:hypothetical protein
MTASDQKRRVLAQTMRQALSGLWYAEPIGIDADDRVVTRCPRRTNSTTPEALHRWDRVGGNPN